MDDRQALRLARRASTQRGTQQAGKHRRPRRLSGFIGQSALGALVLSAVTLIAAQNATTFDVASIKPNVSGDPGAGLDMSRGQVRATNVPVQVLIRQAFDVMDSQIVGAPLWVRDERYDVTAKAPDGVVTAVAMRPLLRALLMDRFKLMTHAETRDMPVFALVRATDARQGPGMREAAFDCAAASPGAASSGASTAAQDAWPMCEVTFKPGFLYVGGYRISEVMRLLTPLVGRTILDETGIATPVQVRLEYQPEGRGAAPTAGAAADERPNLFTALEEQAGLRLVGRRAPVEVLVVDTVERPSPD